MSVIQWFMCFVGDSSCLRIFIGSVIILAIIFSENAMEELYEKTHVQGHDDMTKEKEAFSREQDAVKRI